MPILQWSGAFLALSVAGVVVANVVTAPDCGCEVAQAPNEASAQPGAHDPTIVKEGKTYYLFMTGRGIPMRSSKDLKTWTAEVPVFAAPPEWAPKAIVGFRDHIWAPDVSRFGGKWHLYYSISTFGKNRSAIGHATNVTLDPASKKFKWVDEGPVVQSYPTDGYNAIDPNVVLDRKGTPWLSFGSFWKGLQMVELTGDGRLADRHSPPYDDKPFSIAQRPEPPDAIEAPFVIERGGYYYLFASYDFCCRGAKSTYNVRVGRARDVFGPFVDRDGKSLKEGGGTMVIEGGTRWKGTGHQAVLRDGRTDYLIYHAYDAENSGRPMLQIAKITWDKGWPTVPKAE